jgi:hypothetical protein
MHYSQFVSIDASLQATHLYSLVKYYQLYPYSHSEGTSTEDPPIVSLSHTLAPVCKESHVTQLPPERTKPFMHCVQVNVVLIYVHSAQYGIPSFSVF